MTYFKPDHLKSQTPKAKRARVYRAECAARGITDADRARFWSRVDKSGPGGCWVWMGSNRSKDGYGQIELAGRNVGPHIAVYLVQGLLVPAGKVVDHLCRNRKCCNPAHMRFVPQSVNAIENNLSPFALNKAKTHCIRGHEFSAENTHYPIKGGRSCRACRRKGARVQVGVVQL